jgi:Transmembrane secretion effector
MANVSTSARQQFPVHYHTPRVKALEVFYREAGPPKAPVVLLMTSLAPSPILVALMQTATGLPFFLLALPALALAAD